jgi:Xaa-Pro aminopeptidase
MIFIAKSEASIFYEASYSNDNSLFLSLNGDNFFITDGRYTEEASKSIRNCELVDARDVVKAAVIILKKNRVKKLFIDPSEWSLEEFDKLGSFARIEKRKGLLCQKRAIKSDAEIEKLKNAVKIASNAFDSFAGFLKKNGLGKTEFELNWSAKEILSEFGTRELSFDPIVAIDANSSLPHAKPSEQKLELGSSLLFDAGVRVDGYCSDRTRTICFDGNFEFGYKQKFSSKKMQKVYETVLKAHDEAIKKARVGMRASELDKIARDVIDNAGFGKEFVHSLGHGVGIEIHEYPTISARSQTVLEEGMVFTIEPGIYIPKVGGVRIEDMVVMRNYGVEIL